jgi:hypothetical protein
VQVEICVWAWLLHLLLSTASWAVDMSNISEELHFNSVSGFFYSCIFQATTEKRCFIAIAVRQCASPAA